MNNKVVARHAGTTKVTSLFAWALDELCNALVHPLRGRPVRCGSIGGNEQITLCHGLLLIGLTPGDHDLDAIERQVNEAGFKMCGRHYSWRSPCGRWFPTDDMHDDGLCPACHEWAEHIQEQTVLRGADGQQ